MWNLKHVATALLASVLGAPFYGCAPTPIESPETVSISETTPRRCPVALPVGEKEGETLVCGILTVPENYSAPGDRTLEITYAILHSRSLSPAPDPIVHLVGGPGVSGIATLEDRIRMFETLRRSRDIIIFDQRGAQYSSRLDCKPYFRVLTAQLEEDEEIAALFADLQEQDPETPLDVLQTQIAMSACATGLERELGVDLSQYNSVASVQDTANLVQALGYDTFNLYGISYGTRLALTMMRDRPDNIRSVVLDSAYPLQIDNYENTTNLNEEVILQLFADCQTAPACAAAYPDLKQRFGTLLTELEAAPIPLAEPVELFFSDRVVSRVTPSVMRLLVGQFLNQYPWFAPHFPRIIYELDEGVTTTLEQALAGDLRDTPEGSPSGASETDDLIITAADLRSQADELLRAQAREEVRQRPGYRWLRQVFARASELPDTSRDDAILDLQLINAAPRSVEVLTTYVKEFFTGPAAEALLAELAELDPEEIRSVFEIVSNLTDADTTEGMHYSVECYEEFAFNNLDEAGAIAQSLEFPLLGEAGAFVTDQAAAVCEIWPSGTASTLENEAVRSDIPTLVMAGLYDTQTPPSWNRLAAAELPRSYYVAFPNTGHAVISHSQCARDVAEAFINNPTLEPDATCTGELQPEFVGLDETP
ncbi:MAG: alpha/beta fold hydrolase [Synechococcales bacterium]|nr:alpha/beta fold hydrolase [Synechococcales bacterium]